MVAFEKHGVNFAAALVERVAVQVPDRFRNRFRMAVDVHARLLVEEAASQMDLNSIGCRHDFGDKVIRVESKVGRVGVDVGHVQQPAAASIPQHLPQEFRLGQRPFELEQISDVLDVEPPVATAKERLHEVDVAARRVESGRRERGRSEVSHLDAVMRVAGEAQMIADRLGVVFFSDGQQRFEVVVSGSIRAGDGQLQSVDAHMIKFLIAEVAVDAQRVIGSFKSDLDGVDGWVIENVAVLFAKCVADSRHEQS